MLDPRTEAVSTQKKSWASCSTPNYKCSNIEGVRETREPADGAPCCQSWNHFGSMMSSFCPTIFAHRLKHQILGGSQVSNRQLKLCKVRNLSYRSHLLIGGGWQFVSVTLATVYQEDPSIHLHLVFQEGIERWPSTQQPSWLSSQGPAGERWDYGNMFLLIESEQTGELPFWVTSLKQQDCCLWSSFFSPSTLNSNVSVCGFPGMIEPEDERNMGPWMRPQGTASFRNYRHNNKL